MEQNSLTEEQELLDAQIRELYGRVVYTHKTHLKCADMLEKRNDWIKIVQIGLWVVTTGSFIPSITGNAEWSPIIGLLASAILLFINAYTKKYDLTGIAEKHRSAAANLWDIRETYLSLLTGLRFMEVPEVIKKRDDLQKKLGAIYKSCPPTNSAAYKAAQEALKQNDELFFTDDELDHLLPISLRKRKE